MVLRTVLSWEASRQAKPTQPNYVSMKSSPVLEVKTVAQRSWSMFGQIIQAGPTKTSSFFCLFVCF